MQSGCGVQEGVFADGGGLAPHERAHGGHRVLQHDPTSIRRDHLRGAAHHHRSQSRAQQERRRAHALLVRAPQLLAHDGSRRVPQNNEPVLQNSIPVQQAKVASMHSHAHMTA